MSNGVKVGLLVVIAGVLGLIAFRMTGNTDKIESREAATPQTEQPKAGVNPAQSTVGAASEGRAKTTIAFEESEFDFGNIKQGDVKEHSFKFKNTGSEPLIIENAKGSCGCTVPEYPKDPVLPGATAEIHVKFNSAGKSNKQQKTVTLTANTEPIQTILTIKAFVEVEEK